MAEIADQSIGDIDRRGGEPPQPLAQCDARTRTQKRVVAVAKLVGAEHGARPMMSERKRRVADPTRDIDRITDPGAAAAKCLTRRRFAEDRHAEAERPLRRVAADQIDLELIGQREEAPRELPEPNATGTRQRHGAKPPARP